MLFDTSVKLYQEKKEMGARILFRVKIFQSDDEEEQGREIIND